MPKPLPDNTQHSQETVLYAPGGIRTRNPKNRAVADPCLRPRGHWDRLNVFSLETYLMKFLLGQKEGQLLYVFNVVVV